MKKKNPGYKPFHKAHVVLWIANEKEMCTKSKGGIILHTEINAGDAISRKQEGVIVGLSKGCFEGDNWDSKPKVGDEVCFKGYSGNIYQDGDDFYRIMEDKFLTAPALTNK